MIQTIKIHVDHITHHLDDEGNFQKTNFDELVEDYYECCLESNELPVAKSILIIGEYLLCTIDSRPMTPQEKESIIKSRANKNGIVTDIKDIPFNI